MNISYGKQLIEEDDIKAVAEVLTADFLTQGPAIANFEKEFAQYVGAKHALACSNGTAALHLAMMALKGKDKNKKVLCTPITFAASSNAALYENLEIEFVDIDPQTYLLDIDKLKAKLETNPDAYQGLVVVSFAGLPYPTHELKELREKYNLWIVEDACHAPGAYFDNGEVQFKSGDGQFCDIAIFSFHPVKHIACGEGGMVTTSNDELAQKLEKLRAHGITKNPEQLKTQGKPPWFHEMQELGYNYRLTDIQAALGLTQLRKQGPWLRRRNQIALSYDERLTDKVLRPHRPEGTHHAWHLYVIQTDKRDDLYTHLRNKNIFTQVHYIPVYRHPYYQDHGYEGVECPVAEAYYERCLSLPMYPGLTNEELDYVVDTINEFYA